jgi:hypothetical protein
MNKPGKDTSFTIRDGHIFASTPTGDFGIDSGRPRFKVECLTCKACLHENTTGPSARIESHLRSNKQTDFCQ